MSAASTRGRSSLRARLFAAIYDPLLEVVERRGLADQRRRLLRAASGRVVEIGAGTGRCLEHYPEAVTELVLTEPEPAMAERLEQKVARARRPARVLRASADELPLADGAADVVVSALVLCTVSDVPATLREVRRVLAPGGRLLLLEHVRSEDERLARWQARFTPIQRFVACGCECDRDTVGAVRDAGFEIERLERFALPASYPFVRPAVLATARRPPG